MSSNGNKELERPTADAISAVSSNPATTTTATTRIQSSSSSPSLLALGVARAPPISSSSSSGIRDTHNNNNNNNSNDLFQHKRGLMIRRNQKFHAPQYTRKMIGSSVPSLSSQLQPTSTAALSNNNESSSSVVVISRRQRSRLRQQPHQRLDGSYSRPGAIRVRGIGSNGMGAFDDDDNGTVQYSMGGGGGSGGGDDDDEVAQADDVENNDSNEQVESSSTMNHQVESPRDLDTNATTQHQQPNEDKWKLSRGKKIVLASIVLISLGATGFLISHFRSSRNEKSGEALTDNPLLADNNDEPHPDTYEPSIAPTSWTLKHIDNDTAVGILTEYIPDIPTSSIQQKALEWLVVTDGGLESIERKYNLLERFVMAILYFSLDGNQWSTNHEGWLSLVSVCDWGNVVCDDSRLNIVSLDLFGVIGSSGVIPTELGSLTELTSLDLRSSDLSGHIPSQLGLLTKLTKMNLDFNRLSGPIPSQLGMLTELTRLNLDFNDISGPIPSQLGLLTNLEYLDLQSNNLTGTIPTEIGLLTDLITLILVDNLLTGDIPPELSMLTAQLHIGNNNLNY